jgi:hypothetical protein
MHVGGVKLPSFVPEAVKGLSMKWKLKGEIGKGLKLFGFGI